MEERMQYWKIAQILGCEYKAFLCIPSKQTKTQSKSLEDALFSRNKVRHRETGKCIPEKTIKKHLKNCHSFTADDESQKVDNTLSIFDENYIGVKGARLENLVGEIPIRESDRRSWANLILRQSSYHVTLVRPDELNLLRTKNSAPKKSKNKVKEETLHSIQRAFENVDWSALTLGPKCWRVPESGSRDCPAIWYRLDTNTADLILGIRTKLGLSNDGFIPHVTVGLSVTKNDRNIRPLDYHGKDKHLIVGRQIVAERDAH